MKVIIAGSRNITSHEMVINAVKASGYDITEVVCGCAEGVDESGKNWATIRKIPVKRFPANWNEFGRGAGPIRNQQMADYADALIAIWDGKSRGTADMIKRAVSKPMPYYVYNISLQPIQ